MLQYSFRVSGSIVTYIFNVRIPFTGNTVPTRGRTESDRQAVYIYSSFLMLQVFSQFDFGAIHCYFEYR